jgi:DNA polymerase-3 subunit alpha
MEMIPDYIDRKHGRKPITYDHPLLEPVLKETYGIFVYQEQVMQAASVLAGYSLGGADILRRAMGKKKQEEMDKQRATFVKGCADTNNIPKAQAENIFNLLEKFAGYGFNKSHSAAYAVVAYQTAWLKANYPVEFMAALLSNELADTDKIQMFIVECKRMGIEVLPPDVNASGLRFTVENGAIRFGMAAIKNVGEVAVNSIIAEREAHGPYKSFEEFCGRIDTRTINRKVLECLAKCGAFDSLGQARAQVFSEVDFQMSRAATMQRDRERGQAALFDVEPVQVRKASDTSAPAVEWSQSEMLAYEKELLGFYVSGHPLSRYANILTRYELTTTAQLGSLQDGQPTRLGGIISKFQPRTTKTGKPMGVLAIEDLEGAVEVVVFPEPYAKYVTLLKQDAPVFIVGEVNLREDKPKIYVNQIIPLDDVPRRFTKAVHIRLPAETTSEDTLTAVREILARYRGECPVFFAFTFANGRTVFVEAHDHFAVTPRQELIDEIEQLIGEDTVWLKVDAEKLAAASNARREQRWQRAPSRE